MENITSKKLNSNSQNLKFAAIAPVKMTHYYINSRPMKRFLPLLYTKNYYYFYSFV